MEPIRSTALAVSLALALAACSSAPTSSVTSGPGDDADGGTGPLDCSVLDSTVTQTYSLGIQVLAQLRSQAQVDLVKEGTVAYDPDAVEASLLALRSLAGHGPEGFADPGESVDFYLGANDLARGILEIEGPVPQEQFDALIAYEGDLGEFLSRQSAINAALSENCS